MGAETWPVCFEPWPRIRGGFALRPPPPPVWGNGEKGEKGIARTWTTCIDEMMPSAPYYAVKFLSWRLAFLQSFFLARNPQIFSEILHTFFQVSLMAFLSSDNLAFLPSCKYSGFPETLMS
jgi:hypothetical protein